MSVLDALDREAANAFPGSLVRKDLALKFKGQYPVPTYVGEFLLGRYCASTDPDEIAEGLKIVERQLKERAVRAGEHELFKSRAKEQGTVKLIDLVTARLDATTDSYLVTLPSLQLKDVRIEPKLVRENERMLTGGFYAEIELDYQPELDRASGRPFGVAGLRPIQMSKRDVLDVVSKGRRAFNTREWRNLLLRSVGFEPDAFSERAQELLILRMVPFVENNYNMVELGPRGTGKSHLFQQISPYSHLVSGGKASVAKMFVDNRTGQRGLVAQYDVVCFDEVSGIDFDSKDGVNIMKGYMESGEFSRGKESIRALGGVVMVGNFEVDLEHQLRVGHLLSPMPKEMRDDTAFMDRIHAYIPGWDVPKLQPTMFTDHFGLVSDFLAEAWTRLRDQTRLPAIQGRVTYGSALSGRDLGAVNRTLSGLLKLLYPDPELTISVEDLEWALRLALECRRRIKEQQRRIGLAEFHRSDFTYTVDGGPDRAVETAEGAASESRTASRRPVTDSAGTVAAAPDARLAQRGLSEGQLRDLVAGGESPTVEFKSTLRWNLKLGEDSEWLQKEVTRSVAAFLNGQGGAVVIGVADDGTIVGIEQDMAIFERAGRGGRDGFLQALANVLNQHLGGGVAPLVQTQVLPLDGRIVCVLLVQPSREPIYLSDKNQHEFWVRMQTTTRSLTLPETAKYVRNHWG